ncbi:hypothetical protein AB0937_33510 [Streptomyces sp. NPDC047880]|uniref:hypothetical protein n=1 Tax=Streptomyces sp. NPDC047880 TaxID=3155626 RepID=UPI003451CB0F
MTAHWLSCGGTVPAATTSQWDWGTFPQWLSALGTVAATATALWVASRQRAAQERVLAGVQKEKAAHVALEDLDREGVTVRNHGQTPVTNTLLVRVEVYLDEDGGEDVGWLTVGRARARSEPQRQDLLPAGDSVPFTFTDWSSPEELTLDSSLRWGNPRVTFAYTDAAGTRWRREGGPIFPSHGAGPRCLALQRSDGAPFGARRWRRWGQRRRTAWKNLRLGLRGKGFTRKQRREKRMKKGMQPSGQG